MKIEWGIKELAIAMEWNLSDAQVAAATGRSYTSVQRKRERLRAAKRVAAASAAAAVPLEDLEVAQAPVGGPTLEEDLNQSGNAYWERNYMALKLKYKKVLEEKCLVDRLVDDISELAPQSYDPRPAEIPARASKHEPQSACLMLSDSHVGQTVSPDQTLGFGGYNMSIFKERLARVRNAVMSIVTEHITTGVPELVIWWGGDMLHGNLGHSAEADHVVTLFDQYYEGGHEFAKFVRDVAPIFPKVRCYSVVGNHCVDEQTEILTRRGWLRHTELLPTDECVGLLPDGKTAVWQPILETVREPAVDKMVRLSNRQFSFRGTEHHRFYFRPNGCAAFLEAPYSGIAPLIRQHGIQVAAAGCIEAPGRPDLRPLLALCGAVLTDGSIHIDSSAVIVYQKKEKAAWVQKAFERSGLQFSVRERVRQYPPEIVGKKVTASGPYTELSFRLSSKDARRFLATTKLTKGRMPDWINELSMEEFHEFFRAVLEGDGTQIDSSSPSLIGKSMQFCDELSAACSLRGIGTTVSSSGAYGRISFRTTTTWVGVNCDEMPTETKEGELVWCVRTKTENWLCRRDGRPHFTGNTRWGTQHKMPTVNRFSNLDHFFYTLVAALTKDVPNVQWLTDKQPFSLFDIQGHKFFGLHGDGLRGGDKALHIPGHSIGRMLNCITQLQNKVGVTAPHYYLVGHLHKSMTIPHGMGSVMVNGGFSGIDGFGLSEFFQPVDPIQRFFFVNKKFGVTAHFDLALK